MKKTFLIIAAMAVVLVGCKKDTLVSNVTPSETDVKTVTFSFQPYTMEPIRDVGPISAYCDHLDIFLYDNSNMIAPIAVFHQTTAANGSGFGTLSTDLNVTKTYTMYAVAHRFESEATFDGEVITFPEGRMKHAMFYSDTFTPATTLNKTCLMQRIVAMFKMETTDVMPEEVTKFVFTVDEIGTAWNVNGYSVNKMEKSAVFENFNTNQNGTVSFNVFFLADDLEDTGYVNITVTAYDENDDEVESHVFEEVPLKADWITKYVGSFFVTFNMNFTFQVNPWNEFDPINFLN